ncbi:thioredoxin domain-containing protein [Sphingomonas mesophila]|uniref:thioredoxin domain-containing protein n=1 Tax=Sphingomonas mesophila TaxID=2303576 RepID=UPI000E5989C4|nr:thioredoxin domain-containing protein [Sphingomonas mesophila]
MKAYLLAAALAALPAAAGTAQATDWRSTVVMTAEGGMAIGNPKARVTLVEYGSMTCPHCREFARDGFGPLTANYVKSGKVRFEYRNFVLNGYDLAASLIARCAGPKRFFPATEKIFAEQPKWIARIQGSKARIDAAKALPADKQIAAMADIAGLKPLGVASGIPAARIDQCLADTKAAEQLFGFGRKAAAEQGVKGTPTFFLNGKRVEAHDWATLEPLIKKAL